MRTRSATASTTCARSRRRRGTQAEFGKLRAMVVEVCQERLRMRAEMFGAQADEARIAEITEGRIKPLGAV